MMSRKATFSPKCPKPNSSDHNSRKEIPNYLIENNPKFDGNYYEKIATYQSDEQFIKLAKKIYNEKFIERVGQNQRMQKKQVDALLWEVAISTEEHHTKEDVLALFKMLKNEKSEENETKRGLSLSRLKPTPEKPVYVLPHKLRIKRKPKKENLNESGYHILELAGHADEGHFIRKGIWENLSYYPARDILLKDDGNWYIKSEELSENKSEDTFDILTDMTEFEKVYNYHWHVKYTNFNIDTGLSAQFSKREVSGKGRLKKVAEFLNLDYVPEEKIPFAQGVKTIKEQHHIERQNKYIQLMMKFGNEVDMKISQEKVLKREEILAQKTTNARVYKKKFHESERVVTMQQDKIESLEENIKELQSENNTLDSDLEDKKTQIISDTEILKENQEEIVVLEKKIQELEKLTEPIGYEIEGESVSEDLYVYVETRNKLMNEERIRHERVEEEFLAKEESLNEQIQELNRDVFSETWTRKDKNGENQKSKNINVVKQLEKKSTEFEEKIKVLKEQVEELKNQNSVIKEIPAKIKIDDIKNFELNADGENITVIDLFNRKNKAIKELKEHTTSLDTKIKEKDALITDFEQEIKSDYAWIYTGEIHEVLDVSETYTDEVHETWREKAKELEEKVEELKAEVSQLEKVIDGGKGFISKIFSAFGVGEDEPDGLEKIDKRLVAMESLKNPKKEKPQPTKINTAPKMKF
jgi:DNA repair exonuclease SbcCD ATPase subunit